MDTRTVYVSACDLLHRQNECQMVSAHFALPGVSTFYTVLSFPRLFMIVPGSSELWFAPPGGIRHVKHTRGWELQFQ